MSECCRVVYHAPNGKAFDTKEECEEYMKRPKCYAIIETTVSDITRAYDSRVYTSRKEATTAVQSAEHYTTELRTFRVVELEVQLPTEKKTIQAKITNKVPKSSWWGNLW